MYHWSQGRVFLEIKQKIICIKHYLQIYYYIYIHIHTNIYIKKFNFLNKVLNLTIIFSVNYSFTIWVSCEQNFRTSVLSVTTHSPLTTSNTVLRLSLRSSPISQSYSIEFGAVNRKWKTSLTGVYTIDCSTRPKLKPIRT